MKKLILVYLIFSTLFISASSTVGADGSNLQPNIIIIMVDDMGFAGPSISPYANPYYKTPGMDQLAREGMRFTDFYSSGPVCSPTRAGLLTGRYQQRAGIEAVIHPLPGHPEHLKGLQGNEVTFAELFKAAGYSTGAVGKWHLGYPEETPEYHPQNHGFDYFTGYHSGNIDYINHWGDHYEHDWWHGKKETREEGYTTHLINKYALDFIDQNKDKPFCLYVSHESPHSPVQGPKDPVQRGPGKATRITSHEEAMKQMILEMDKGVAQIREKIIELGLDQNTFILFFSDNGDAPGTATGSPQYRGHKGSVYEGGLRVPAIGWWPGRIEPDVVTDSLAISIDVMPTILSIAGIGEPKERSLDGVDLSPVLFEQKPMPERSLYWGYLSNGGARSEAMRDGPWKLVVQHPGAKEGTYDNETIELYRLDRDAGEKNDLAARKPGQASRMLKQLKAWLADTRRTQTPQPGGWIESGLTAEQTERMFREFRDDRQNSYSFDFFNGKDLTGWSSKGEYWSVKDGAIVGHSDSNIPKNAFLWSDVEVGDFYLSVEVKLSPANRNAGIQFRSKPIDDSGQAVGYQADAGHAERHGSLWGKLYHEHGRGKLDWNDRGKEVANFDDWNHYEILAVGDRIWTAVNGTLCTAVRDPGGESAGKIAFQIHSGLPQTVQYRNPVLTHDPKVTLAGLSERELDEQLAPPLDQSN